MGSCWRATSKMRGSFLLLLHATSLFGATLLDQMEVSAPDCRTPGCDRVIVAWGKNLTRPSSLVGIFDLTTPSTSQPLDCPTTHCKRPSLKKRGTTICCPLIRGRNGRVKCPNSCD